MINLAYIRLNERAKELKCIYDLEELLKNENNSIDIIFNKLLEIIPPAWQYPTVCEVRIIYEDKVYKTEDFRETDWCQKSDIVIDSNIIGEIQVYYTQFIRLINNSQFIAEEQKLLNIHRKLKNRLKQEEQEMLKKAIELRGFMWT